jgi:hypothetical protein
MKVYKCTALKSVYSDEPDEVFLIKAASEDNALIAAYLMSEEFITDVEAEFFRIDNLVERAERCIKIEEIGNYGTTTENCSDID